MDWMYKGVSGLADRDEYLTGRRIDKTFEIIEAEENQTKGDLETYEPSVPQPLLNQIQTNPSMVTIDLAAKQREDPLYEIRMKQREQRKKLLDNPLKMKKLKSILESTLKDDKRRHHKKKRRRRSDSSDSDVSDRKGSKGRHRRDRERSGRQSDDANRHQTREDKRHKDHKRQSHRCETSGEWRRHENRSGDRNSGNRPSKASFVPKRPKLSAEELEQKRKEMADNAFWRETERKRNVMSYDKEEKDEIELNSTAISAQFIKPLLKNASEKDTLEDRIRQKRFTSQKGYNLMDYNFAKK